MEGFEHVAEVGAGDKELRTIGPAADGTLFIRAIKKIDVAEFEQAIIDGQLLRPVLYRAAVEEFAILIPIQLLGHVMDVLELETSVDLIGR